MMEFILGVIVGILIMGLVAGLMKQPKKPKAEEPTEWEKRQAERVQREYMNFMTYDGTPQDDIQ